jgi:hypothetical protein
VEQLTAIHPLVLRLDELTHRAFLGSRELVRVTTALEEAGLIDTTWFTEESRIRGQYLHDAIKLHHEHDLAEDTIDPVVLPFWAGYLDFLAESRFVIASAEQAVHDATQGYAGRYDLLGTFPDLPDTALDLIDVKTGKAPAWVKLQTALYRRCLIEVTRCRRWVLELPGDGRYHLRHLNLQPNHQIDRMADVRHEQVGLSAVMCANFKRGLIR